jgi:hypothetical protein
MLVIYPLNRVGAFTKFGTKTIINFSTGVLIEVALPGSPTVSVISITALAIGIDLRPLDLSSTVVA